MKNSKFNLLSQTRLNRLRGQGYFTQSDAELSQMAFGIRFAYRSCLSLLVVGVTMANIPILASMMTIAFFGVVLPNHPFDYFYNHFLADRMQRPKLPKRDVRLKFACSIATLWIGTTIAFFFVGNMLAGYIAGGSLLMAVISVSFIDLCIPSVFYNMFSKPKLRIYDKVV